MAVTRGFGQQLREARVSHGLTYGTVSRKLRIRPDIIQAIEEEDFSSMPPRANTRGMIHAYAQLLGLNANAVVDDYSNAALEANTQQGTRRRYRSPNVHVDVDPQDFEYQDTMADESANAARERIRQRRARRNGQVVDDSTAEGDFNRGRRGASHSRRQAGAGRRREESQAGNALNAAKNVFAGAAGTVANAVGGAVGSRRKMDMNHSIYADRAKQDGFPGSRSNRSINSYKGTYNVMQSRSYGMGSSRGSGSKLPLIIGAAVVLVILIVASTFLFNKPAANTSTSGNAASAAGSSSVAISGLTDPGAAGTVEQEIKVIPIAPTAAVFTYEILDGEEAYVEIYLNDSSSPDVATVLSGPKRGTYDVTGTLSFVTSRPHVCVLKLDGQTVEPEDKKGNGIYVYDVDFSDILAAWKEANGQ